MKRITDFLLATERKRLWDCLLSVGVLRDADVSNGDSPEAVQWWNAYKSKQCDFAELLCMYLLLSIPDDRDRDNKDSEISQAQDENNDEPDSKYDKSEDNCEDSDTENESNESGESSEHGDDSDEFENSDSSDASGSNDSQDNSNSESQDSEGDLQDSGDSSESSKSPPGRGNGQASGTGDNPEESDANQDMDSDDSDDSENSKSDSQGVGNSAGKAQFQEILDKIETEESESEEELSKKEIEAKAFGKVYAAMGLLPNKGYARNMPYLSRDKYNYLHNKSQFLLDYAKRNIYGEAPHKGFCNILIDVSGSVGREEAHAFFLIANSVISRCKKTGVPIRVWAFGEGFAEIKNRKNFIDFPVFNQMREAVGAGATNCFAALQCISRTENLSTLLLTDGLPSDWKLANQYRLNDLHVIMVSGVRSSTDAWESRVRKSSFNFLSVGYRKSTIDALKAIAKFKF